jgi:hypothetical protein
MTIETITVRNVTVRKTVIYVKIRIRKMSFRTAIVRIRKMQM